MTASDGGDAATAHVDQELSEFAFSVPEFQPGDALSIPAPDGTKIRLRLPRNAMAGDKMFMKKNEIGDWVIKRISRRPALSTPALGPGDDSLQDSSAMDDPVDPDAVSIMCLGDSHTHGWHHAGGYRIHLWELMMRAGWKVRFVGKLRNGPRTFDCRHEGWPGYTIEELTTGRGEDIDVNLDRDLPRFEPDLILLLIGSNDVIQETELGSFGVRLQSLLDMIYAKLPKVKVLLANLPNLRGMEDVIGSVNQQFAMIERASTRSGWWLRLVDVNSTLEASDFHDSAHLNPGGFDKLADVFFKALKDHVFSQPKPSAVEEEVEALKRDVSAALREDVVSSPRSPRSPRSPASKRKSYRKTGGELQNSAERELARKQSVSSVDEDARRREEAAREDIRKRMQHYEESTEKVTKCAGDARDTEATRIADLEKALASQFAVGDYISGLEEDELACTIS